MARTARQCSVASTKEIAMPLKDRVHAVKREIAEQSSAALVARKKLRGPADLTFTIAESITTLNTAAWDVAAQSSSFFLSSHYLRGMEDLLPHNITPRYALISVGAGTSARVIACVYMQIVEIGLAQLRNNKVAGEARASPLKKIATAMAAKTTERHGERINQHVLTCGNFLTYGQHGVAIANGADVDLVWHGVAEVLYRVRAADAIRSKTHFVLIKDLHVPFATAAKQLEHLSYRYVETEPNMVLELNPTWKTYEDYVASLSSKYRANLRNLILKPFEDSGGRVELLTDLAPHRDRLFALYQAVQANAKVRPFMLREEYFEGLQRLAGDNLRVTAAMQHGSIIGFIVTLRDGDTAIAYHIGFDRDAAESLPVYLRLLHASIDASITMGAKRISFGRTALEPKAALGAKPQPFAVLVRHRQPILNKLIKSLLLNIEHAEPPERNPFKKSHQVH
jgi:predicted N-acyltransferase